MLSLVNLETETITYEYKECPVTICNKLNDKYGFGFNGQMKVNEVAGIGNWNSAQFWEYDTRTATRKNIDPKLNRWESSYAVFGGNPIKNIDWLGDKWKTNDDKEKAKEMSSMFKEKEKKYRENARSFKKLYEQAEADNDQEKVKEYGAKWSDAIEGSVEMKNAQRELKEMDFDDKITFTFQDRDADSDGGYAMTTWAGSADNLTVTIPYYARAMPLTAHETKHGYHILKGQFTPAFGTGNGTLYHGGITEEYDGLKRQYFTGSFASFPMKISSFRQINAERIRNVTNSRGEKIYNHLQDELYKGRTWDELKISE